MSARSPGPAWVGIGSQRSGTTWFTRMLVSHPMVTLGRGGRKEQHYFNRYAIEAWTDAAARRYAAMFSAANGGEFTPAYMRQPWVAGLLDQACEKSPLIIALVRDPLERFASAVRWQMARSQDWMGEPPRRRSALVTRWTERAMLGSMYGPQLAAWRDAFGRDTMMVIQYEALRQEPEAVVRRVWRRLGLEAVPLHEVTAASRTVTRPEAWRASDAIDAAVVAHVRDAVEQAVAEWDLDVSLWDSWRAALR